MVSQNSPFIPIHDAWKAGSRAMLPLDDNEARKMVEEIDAKVLSNRKPPYPPAGGLFDALTDTGGDVLLATNDEAREAARLFLEAEGIDIHPAAAVATATLIKAAREGRIDKDKTIMLNITGGGENRINQDKNLTYLKPVKIFDPGTEEDKIKEVIKSLF